MLRLCFWCAAFIAAGFVGGIGTPSVSAQPQVAQQGKRITVVIDAGHGGPDTGATDNQVREKDINLAVAQALSAALTNSGASVRLARKADNFVPLAERARSAEEQKADYFLSIHSEAQQQSKPPVEPIIYFHSQNGPSRSLASAIAHQTASALRIPAVDVRSDTTLFPQGFRVLRSGAVPAILVSLGDLTKLQDPQMQQRVAEAIAAGLAEFATAHESRDRRK